ncbi:MAG: Vitamin B12 dependent methionine synthase activation subunit [Clostridiales bacterium]|nr:Vitamin B12 dependent methionine synthase activation subunit [Clostridiales bacterium]
MITRYQASAAEVAVSSEQALHYAGQGALPPSRELADLLASCLVEFSGVAAYRAAALEVEIMRTGAGLTLGPLYVESKDLSAHLEGCDRAILFCATVGGEPDRLLLRYGRQQTGRAVLLDAIGSAAVEAWCDKIVSNLAKGRILRPRFSPGYGDFALSCQGDLLALLSAAQTTGISVTAAGMMTPQKSVTAVVGIQAAMIEERR